MSRLALVFLLLLTLPGAFASSDPDIRIQVFGLFSPKELQIKAGSARILLLSTERAQVRLEGGQTALCQWNPEGVQCEIGPQQLSGRSIEVKGLSATPLFELAIPGKITRVFRGRLQITPAAGALRAVVAMDLETAVSSIVAAESAPDAGMEALKAQAIATRSYLRAGPRHREFDFCDTTHCQFLRAAPAESHPASQAAAATRGLVLSYHGDVLRALYSRSCAGATRTLGEAGLAAEGYPYFSVVCEACRRHPEKWRSEIDREKLEGVLEDRSEQARLEVARQIGWSRLPSTNFSSLADGDSLTLEGAGIGHGIGLCQRGAAALAAGGADFQKILSHYFPNTSLMMVAH